ncbi:MAG: glycosyltransferase family 4 protein [Actinobacteria bacterium]|nr:MAG: glycosyltransferase family 4 protein [Actinomycetota bacterium]
MKIAQIAPVWERVPPRRYGGIEAVVHLLTEGLVQRGHDVTLFATGDSKTKAKLVSYYHTPPPRTLYGKPLPDLLHTGQAFKEAANFEIIHSHTGYTGVAFGSFIKTPVLNTLHGIFTDVNYSFYETYAKDIFYSSISLVQRKLGPKDLNYVGNVYNAIDINSYPFSKEKEDYFVYLSRISSNKGSDIAVDVALKAGVKLIIAGKIDPGSDSIYFETKLAPKIDNKQIIFKGEVSESEKRQLFKKAKGFIFSLQWPEPFGLVMIESMATGTPVIAFPFGSVPEIIEDSKTGYIVEDIEQMVEAVKKIDRINPEDCREHVAKEFGVKKMVSEYENIYDKIIQLKTG